MSVKVIARFCAYEHLGGCSERLTHKVDYWRGAARERFGPFAYYCGHHAPQAAVHLDVVPLQRTWRRLNTPRK